MSADLQTVIFIDLDGTIMVNPFEAAVWPVVLGEIAAKSGAPLETVRHLIVEENERRQNDESVSPMLAMDWDDIAETTARRLGVTLESSAEALVRQYAASHSAVLDNGQDVLRELIATHRALVAATKGLAKYQLPVLDALGLTPLFTAVLTPDTHNALKNHRRFFGDWSARLHIMVGDRYDDDVLYPSQHGFKTVWKNPDLPDHLYSQNPFARAASYPYPTSEPVHASAIIRHLQELSPVVARLEQQGDHFMK
jgi:putative hydrolase of the HAD superfamily